MGSSKDRVRIFLLKNYTLRLENQVHHHVGHRLLDAKDFDVLGAVLWFKGDPCLAKWIALTPLICVQLI